MAQSGSNKKVANSLVAVSCGAVLAVYTAGYDRTKSAVDQFEAQAAERRAADPAPRRIESSGTEFRPRMPEPPTSALVLAAPLSPNPAPDAAGTPGVIAPVELEPAPELTQAPTPSSQKMRTTERSGSVSCQEDGGRSVLCAPAETPAPPVAAVAAPVVIEAPAPVPAPAPKWKDGTYYGWGTSRHGDIQAEVVIEHGRIAATISQCRTRYPCSVIEQLPPEVAQRQSPDVDYVSRATQSANAFYFAVVDALSKAK